MRRLCVVAFALALGGCVASSGEKASGFFKPSVAGAYIPLDHTTFLIVGEHAAAVTVAPGIAVTNAHNYNLIDKASMIGRSSEYDLLFFHRPGGTPLAMTQPHAGEEVVAYGQGTDGELRVARIGNRKRIRSDWYRRNNYLSRSTGKGGCIHCGRPAEDGNRSCWRARTRGDGGNR